MQHWLNVMRINRVHQAALRHGWYSISLDDFHLMPMVDYGDRIEVTDGEGHVYTVANFDPDDQVTLRRIG